MLFFNDITNVYNFVCIVDAHFVPENCTWHQSFWYSDILLQYKYFINTYKIMDKDPRDIFALGIIQVILDQH